jgi:hypothetical protein
LADCSDELELKLLAAAELAASEFEFEISFEGDTNEDKLEFSLEMFDLGTIDLFEPVDEDDDENELEIFD